MAYGCVIQVHARHAFNIILIAMNLTICTDTRQAEATSQCDELREAQFLVPKCLKLFIQCLQALPPVDGLLQWVSVRRAAVRLKIARGQLHRCHDRFFFGFQAAT